MTDKNLITIQIQPLHAVELTTFEKILTEAVERSTRSDAEKKRVINTLAFIVNQIDSALTLAEFSNYKNGF